ncbi:hypothetical protein WJX81_007007 [Elliptochloris bilobata]|uniref:Globin n=1 Tax=Elliptochloris bilobata TaxID=381761 RepID=A0AAW1RNN6_9CHLO
MVSADAFAEDTAAYSGALPSAPQVVLVPQPESAKTIYKRLGGRPAVLAAVELLYQKMLADPRLSKFFVGVDMEKLLAHQVAFLTLVFGGCQQYLAPSLANAHAHLIREQGLTVEHFDMVLEHLGDALEELDAALHELAEASDLVGVAGDVMAALESLRPAFEMPVLCDDKCVERQHGDSQAPMEGSDHVRSGIVFLLRLCWRLSRASNRRRRLGAR